MIKQLLLRLQEDEDKTTSLAELILLLTQMIDDEKEK